MKLNYMLLIPYLPLTLLTCRVDYLAFIGNKPYTMGLICKHPLGVACPQSVYILIVNIYLYLTLTIWSGKVEYLIVSGNRTNDLLIKPVDPAHEQLCIFQPW